jgi:hypothetical protein
MEFCGPRGRFDVPWAASQILAPTSPRVGTGVFAWPSDVVGANTSPLRSGGGRRSVSKIWLSTNGSPALGETLGDADGEREREHHKKWIQIIQHVWKIFISFVFNHWGFWSHGGSQVILDFSLRNGKTWIIWGYPPWLRKLFLMGWWPSMGWWIIVAWLGARCLKYGRCHPKMVISCDSYVWIRWREAVVRMMFLSQQLHHIQSIMW